jgi:predicted GIY-YIG superfamily endonuclease
VTGLYLLHFDPPYLHAGHYLGFAEDVDRRVSEHLAANGKASPLVRAALAAGSAVSLARTWPGGDRKLERRLKNQHNTPRLCLVCRAQKEANS